MSVKPATDEQVVSRELGRLRREPDRENRYAIEDSILAFVCQQENERRALTTRAEEAEALLHTVVAAVRRSERANDMYRHGQGNDLDAVEIQQGAARAMQDALAEAEAHLGIET